MPFSSLSNRVLSILGLTLCFILLAIAFIYFGREKSAPFLLVLVGLFTIIGVWTSFLALAGVIDLKKNKSYSTQGLLLDNLTPLCAITSKEGTINEVSGGFKQLFGRFNELSNFSIETLLNEDNRNGDAFFRLMQALKKGTNGSEMIKLNFDNQRLSFKVSASPFQGENKDKYLWFLEDQTQETDENERLFSSVQRTFAYIDNAPAGFFVVNSKGQINFINDMLAKWIGRDLAHFESNGLTVSDVLAPHLSAIFMNSLPHSNETDSFEGLIESPNGEKNVKILRQCVEIEGQPFYHCLAIEVFAPRSKPEQSLHLAQSRLAHYFEHSPLGLMVLDKQGVVRRTNPVMAQLQSELKTKTTPSLVSFVQEAARKEMLLALNNSQKLDAKTQVVEFPLDTQKPGWGRFYITPLPENEEESEAILVYMVDISEQRSLLDQFAQSQKMQAVGQLAGGVAHDFNNVLQAIIGNCELLLMNMRTTDPSFGEIRDIKSNANRAAALVRQLLAFSRKQTFRMTTLHVNDVISDMSPLLKRSVSEKMSLELNYGRDLWAVRSDLTQIEQVLLNLVVNARDAMVNGGKLYIKTENFPASRVDKVSRPEMSIIDYVRIDVKDEGTGIPLEIQKQIFEPFFTTKDLNKGTGLGLSTVYGIIKQTGGYIYLDSVMGQGTTFSIYLPRHIEAEKEITLPSSPSITPPPAPAKDMTGNGKILLVEDELAVRAFGQRALTARGYEVLPADSGVEALEIFEEENGEIDLVISDVVMPEMDGPTLLGELRKRNPNVKFIFVSGYAEEAFAKNLPSDQSFHFLAKPFQMAELIEKVKEVMAG